MRYDYSCNAKATASKNPSGGQDEARLAIHTLAQGVPADVFGYRRGNFTGTLAAGTRAKSDAELVRSWADSLRSAHSRRNFEKTALRFLEALPAGIRKATVEDVREALAAITEGASDATAQQYVLRVKSLLSYGHKLGYMAFNASVTRASAGYQCLLRSSLALRFSSRKLQRAQRMR